MSICLAVSLAASSTATNPTTASLPGESLTTYAWAIVQMTLVLAAGVALFWATYGRQVKAWAPRRIRGPIKSRPVLAPIRVLDTSGQGRPGSEAGLESGTDVGAEGTALPLWLGAAAMVWISLAVPTLLTVTSSDTATTRAIGADGTMVGITAITYASGLAGVALLHFAWRRCEPMKLLGLTPAAKTFAPGKAIVAAAIALPATYLVAVTSMLAWQLLQYRHESSHAMLQLMDRNESSPWVVWVTVVNATLFAPVFEEVLFRGHLQTALTAAFTRSRWPAIAFTSLLFALMHDAWTMPAMFALSIAIGAAYEWSGSLWVAIAVHAAFNATSTTMFLGGR